MGVYVYMYIPLFSLLFAWFCNYHLSGVCLWFLIFSYFLSSHLMNKKPLVESLFLTRGQALKLWSGSTDSKTLDYQRTNPREYQIVKTHTRKPLDYKTQHHPTTGSTLGRRAHLNNRKQRCKPDHQQTGLPSYSALPIRGKENKQKTEHKSHPIQS